MNDTPPPLLDPVTAHRVRHTLVQSLRGGCTVREAMWEARGYLKAVSPALPQTHVAEAVEELLAELDPLLGDLVHCEPDARAQPPGQMRFGF